MEVSNAKLGGLLASIQHCFVMVFDTARITATRSLVVGIANNNNKQSKALQALTEANVHIGRKNIAHTIYLLRQQSGICKKCDIMSLHNP